LLHSVIFIPLLHSVLFIALLHSVIFIPLLHSVIFIPLLHSVIFIPLLHSVIFIALLHSVIGRAQDVRILKVQENSSLVFGSSKGFLKEVLLYVMWNGRDHVAIFIWVIPLCRNQKNQ